MKASEFIKVVEKAIEEYGDLEIVVATEGLFYIHRNLIPQELDDCDKEYGYLVDSQEESSINSDGEIIYYTGLIDNEEKFFTDDKVFML